MDAHHPTNNMMACVGFQVYSGPSLFRLVLEEEAEEGTGTDNPGITGV